MKDKIFAVCNSLTSKGIKPTLESVRKELGGGSFSTINPILKEWKESQTSKPMVIAPIPPEAAKAVEQATSLIWSIATEHQAEAISAIQAESVRIEQAAIAERDEAFLEIERLEARVKELDSANSEKAREINKQRDDINKDVQTLNKLKREAEIQQVKLDNATKATQKAENETQKLREQNASQAETIHILKLEVEKERLNLETLSNAMRQQSTEIEQLKAVVNRSDADAKSQTKEINLLSLQNQKLQVALDSSSKTLDETKAEMKELRQKAEQAQNEASKLAGMLEALQKDKK